MQVVDNIFTETSGSFFRQAGNTNMAVPPAGIVQNDREYVLTLPASGIQREQTDVCVKDGVLYISARKKKKHVHCGNNLCDHDCVLWRRAFALPENADTLMIAASYHHSELLIRIPKKHHPHQDDVTIYVY